MTDTPNKPDILTVSPTLPVPDAERSWRDRRDFRRDEDLYDKRDDEIARKEGEDRKRF